MDKLKTAPFQWALVELMVERHQAPVTRVAERLAARQAQRHIAAASHKRAVPMTQLCRPLVCLVLLAVSRVGAAQDSPERAGVLAIADSALAAISRGDFKGFTDLMVDEAVLFPTTTRNGEFRYVMRTRSQQREAQAPGVITERGFRPEVRVAGPVAVVWYPYDLYIDGKWSHCGVDIFTLIKRANGWRITTVTWSAEQPPVCERHPGGPPR
jgi:hypothetical protein